MGIGPFDFAQGKDWGIGDWRLEIGEIGGD